MIKLYGARSLLYRRQSLQENIRWNSWKALDEIYKIYMLLHRSEVNISRGVNRRSKYRLGHGPGGPGPAGLHLLQHRLRRGGRLPAAAALPRVHDPVTGYDGIYFFLIVLSIPAEFHSFLHLQNFKNRIFTA